MNLGGATEISIGALARRIVALLDSPSEIVLVPYSRAYGEGYEDMRRRVPDNTLAGELIGFTVVALVFAALYVLTGSGFDAAKTALAASSELSVCTAPISLAFSGSNTGPPAVGISSMSACRSELPPNPPDSRGSKRPGTVSSAGVIVSRSA